MLDVKEKEKLRKKHKRCRLCNSKKELQFHHMIPDTGTVKYNIIPMCKKCHSFYHKQWDKVVSNRINKGIRDIKAQMFDNFSKNGIKPNELLFAKFSDLKKEIKKKFDELEGELQLTQDKRGKER